MSKPRGSTSRLDKLLELASPGERGASRRAVLAHALPCFNARGIEAATIEELRQRSGQSVGTIYHHFGNKEGVAAALFFAGFDDQSRAIAERTLAAPDAHAVVVELVAAYVGWVTALPELAAYLFMARETIAQGLHGEALRERLEARYGPIDSRLAEGVRTGLITELPSELIPALVLGGAESYCRAWLAGRRRARPTAYAGLLAEAAWRGIAA
ncbi:AcrR family transcriptional regulator [Pelomonas saccharophila]|uniref:AcrR family transcriptional regulator n=1 Tax=Roseateles saccharophilus TaxID=304 RepID=A0ABU1YRV5_ROSSA|nr:TetR/AcrR family transcriptional regulator [Roseateles saccharophilus]MDR7271572.1 AcrR family transcriptional regulator [Roseateles saccharophilus]